jgi:pyrimidine deaminase RibD-like protein/GNAT superfamily N-acetyltransferase
MNLDEIESFPSFRAGSTSMNRLSPDPYGRWGETDQSAKKNLEQVRKAARQLPGSPYLYTIVPQRSNQRPAYYIYVLTPDGEVIGGLDIDDHGKMFEVDKIQVLPKYKGQGLGMSLYGIALSILKKPLVAGTAQTPDSQRAWLRLSQIPGVQVMGLLQMRRGLEPFYQWKVDELEAKPWIRVGNHQLYLFPVTAGKKRMKVAQPKVHKIYGRDTDELYTTMIAFYNQQPVLESVQPTVVQENPNAEISQHKKLDRVLIRLCEMLQAAPHPKFGMVAAAVIDPDNRIVAALNRRLSQDKNLHAEPAAMRAYEKRYGAIPDGSIIVTTLSPCAEPMAERQGQACVERINQSNVHKVYCGYMDHTQHEGLTELREFTLEETANPDIRRLCKKYADTFLEDDVAEDYDPNGPPPGPETKPTMPAGTVKVDVSDVYDWYKLGQHISNLKGLGKHDFGQGPPSTIISFGSEEEEHKYIKDLEKTGLTTTDIDPVDPNRPRGMPRQKTDPTYNVGESVTNITELWTQPYELTSRVTGPANMEYYFDTKDNRSGRIVFDSFLDTDEGGLHAVLVVVHFYIDNLFHTSGKGDSIAIFSTVVAACRDYLRRYKPPVVAFETDDSKKRNLYVRMSGMFPDYVVYPYPQWGQDPIVGDEIFNSLMDGNAKDAVVLHRRNYDPEKTRMYIDEQGPSNDTAISLSKLGKFHPGTDPLAEFVPERATAQYALHPDKWESTFYSLTNKDSDKLKYYGPKKISIPPGTLVGDMAIANKFYRAKTAEEKQQYAELYRESLKPYPVDVSAYRMPELLIPQQGVAEDAMRGVIYTKPNLENEWPEANRYPEFHKLGKDQWIKIARQGSMAKWSSLNDVGNVDSDLSNLEPEKRKRAAVLVNRGKVELPIVGRWSNGELDLIAGNTRIATLLDQGHDPKVWVVDVPDVDIKENFADGKVKGKSRPGRVKRSGASCNGSVTDLRRRAKNASGEKAKMYHWCANMKSGRSKNNESQDTAAPISSQTWIDQIHDMYPQTWQNNHVMPMGGEGEDQQFAMFELVPSTSKKNAVDIKWFQAYPLRQGVGSRAIKELQRLAREADITLTLYPWDKGRVSQAKLMKFYRGQGFQPTAKGSKNMFWSPEKALESGLMESWQAFRNSK